MRNALFKNYLQEMALQQAKTIIAFAWQLVARSANLGLKNKTNLFPIFRHPELFSGSVPKIDLQSVSKAQNKNCIVNPHHLVIPPKAGSGSSPSRG